jgi:hypothetical protein
VSSRPKSGKITPAKKKKIRVGKVFWSVEKKKIKR